MNFGMIKKSALTLILLAFCLSGIAFAQDFKDQAPFDNSELGQFMETWPGFIEWAEEHGEEYGDVDTAAEAQACSQELLSYLSGKGWTGNRFFYVSHQVALGLAALETEENNPKLNAEMDQAIQEIMNNPDIPPAQKDQMLAMMKTSQGQMNQIQEMQENIPPQEMALITANRAKLKEIMSME